MKTSCSSNCRPPPRTETAGPAAGEFVCDAPRRRVSSQHESIRSCWAWPCSCSAGVRAKRRRESHTLRRGDLERHRGAAIRRHLEVGAEVEQDVERAALRQPERVESPPPRHEAEVERADAWSARGAHKKAVELFLGGCECVERVEFVFIAVPTVSLRGRSSVSAGSTSIWRRRPARRAARGAWPSAQREGRPAPPEHWSA